MSWVTTPILAEVVQARVAHVKAAQPDGAGGGVVQAEEQAGGVVLPLPGTAQQAQHLPGRHLERDVLQHEAALAGIARSQPRRTPWIRRRRARAAPPCRSAIWLRSARCAWMRDRLPRPAGGSESWAICSMGREMTERS